MMAIVGLCCWDSPQQCCIILSAFSVSALMSALLFRRLDCWIIDHHLWFETWVSSEGGQHNLISLFTLCRSLRKARLQYTEYMIPTELTSSQFHVLDDFQTRKGWVEHYRPTIAYSERLEIIINQSGLDYWNFPHICCYLHSWTFYSHTFLNLYLHILRILLF